MVQVGGVLKKDLYPCGVVEILYESIKKNDRFQLYSLFDYSMMLMLVDFHIPNNRKNKQ